MTDWRNNAIESGRAKGERLVVKKKKRGHKTSCKALECILCTLRFSLEDVFDGRYNIETFVCSPCYAEMQQKPHAQSCFGKPTFIMLNGKRELGYDATSKECQEFCLDRPVCKRIVTME